MIDFKTPILFFTYYIAKQEDPQLTVNAFIDSWNEDYNVIEDMVYDEQYMTPTDVLDDYEETRI